MRKLTTKLLFAIISAAFALVALGTTTFAWFTISNTASVSQFSAQVTAGQGLEISLDDTYFYTTIPASVIQAKIDSLNVTLKDVTSPDGVKMYYLDDYLDDDDEIEYGGTSNPYIEFDLYVRSPVASTKVNLSSVSFSSNTDHATWTPDTIFVNAKNKLVVPYEDATKLIAAAPALKEAGIITDFQLGSEEEPLESVAYRNNEDIFPVANIEFGPKAYYAHDALRLSISDGDTTVVYQKAADTTNTLLGEEPISNGMVDYYKNKNGIDLMAKYTPDTLPTTTTLSFPETVTTLGAANSSKKLTVRIWVEGWDPDTFNAILTQNIYVSLLLTSAS
jgi:hypothetical protein